MHPRVLDERNTAAQKRILDAAHRLAESTGLKDELAALIHAGADQRDPAVAALEQREAIADLLEALVNSGAGESADQPADANTELVVTNDAELAAKLAASEINESMSEPGETAEEPAAGGEEPEDPDRKARRQRVRRLGKG